MGRVDSARFADRGNLGKRVFPHEIEDFGAVALLKIGHGIHAERLPSRSLAFQKVAFRFMVLTAAVLTIQALGQEFVVGSSAELRKALEAAKPGAVINLAPGEYQGGLHFDSVHGTAKSPIVVRALNPQKPPTFRGGVQFSRISHVAICDLTIEKSPTNGLNIDDDGTISSPSHHVLLRNIVVRDLPKGNHDGIKLSGVDDFQVLDCRIEKWGGSAIDMVGCHRGTIVGCTFRQGGDSAVQTKGGSSDVSIEECRFEDFGQRGVNIGGSTGMPYFRPAVSAMPANAKYEAKQIEVVGCTFVRGGAPIAFVGVDGATVRFNTIYRPGRWAVRILQETTESGFVPSRGGVFSDNLIAFRSDELSSGGINIGPGTNPNSFRFARNFWYCVDSPPSSRPRLPTAEREGQYGLDPQFLSAETGDFRVSAGSPAAAFGAHAWKGR